MRAKNKNNFVKFFAFTTCRRKLSCKIKTAREGNTITVFFGKRLQFPLVVFTPENVDDINCEEFLIEVENINLKYPKLELVSDICRLIIFGPLLIGVPIATLLDNIESEPHETMKLVCEEEVEKIFNSAEKLDENEAPLSVLTLERLIFLYNKINKFSKNYKPSSISFDINGSHYYVNNECGAVLKKETIVDSLLL